MGKDYAHCAYMSTTVCRVIVFSPTQDQRDMVRAMAGYGVPAADIARVAAKGVSESDFSSAFADELEEGQIQAAAKLQEQLYTQAVNGNTAALLHLSRQQLGQAMSSIATTADMCSILGCSKVSLHDMRKRGVVEMVSRDRWDVRKTVRAVCAHLREVAAGRRAGGKQAEDAPDLVTERALLARAQREAVEMSNEVERGNLMRREDVAGVLGRVAGPLSRELETIPDRLERDMRVSGEVVEYVRGVIRVARDGMATAIDDVCRRGA